MGGDEPLLPQRQRRFRHPGRKRLDDRLALQGILFVLHTGIAWEHLPQELVGMPAWAQKSATSSRHSSQVIIWACRLA
ncbi:transposase [Streptosporangium amethystogenes subsp. fukuiense]|uniref:Transposase n=1 Tax=Streptosporangium amethystogenes subsp. fukuiense TaxID=698418 RepID=A0ABW2SXN5_9ACTN